MKKILFCLVGIVGIQLTACSSIPYISSSDRSSSPGASESTAIGGRLEHLMDENDKKEMSSGLDKALGKSTEWSNPRTGIKYTVTPVAKLKVGDNPFCRRYQLNAIVKGQPKSVTGTACVSLVDSTWRVANT